LQKIFAMKFKVGDRVKFLNEQGGGVVSKVISSKLVHVTIEDGFDIPTLTSELIKMDEQAGPGSFFNETYTVPMQGSPEKQEVGEIEFEERESDLIHQNLGKQYPPGIYLAFIPQEQKWLITGSLDIYIINHTDYEILFSLVGTDKKGRFPGIDYAGISPRSKILIETIERDEINDWCEGYLQLLFHKDISNQLILPVHTIFKFKPSKLYKEANYHHSSFVPEKSFLLSIFELSQAKFYSDHVIDKKTENSSALIQKATQAVPTALIDRHKIKARIAEVDLHISALENDYKDLSNHEILKIQTNYFSRCLENALLHHYQKVYFIHGIGNGVLKNAITEILNEYGDIEFMDAPYDKYGTGAMEVILRENQ